MDYKKVQAYFFLGILLIVLGINLTIFSPYFYAMVMALIFAVILHPLYVKLLNTSFFKKTPSLSAFVILFFLILLIITPLLTLGILLVKEATALYFDLTSSGVTDFLVNNLQQFANQHFPNANINIANNFNDYFNQFLKYLINNLGALFSNVFALAFSFFIMLFGVYYLLKDGKKFRQALVMISPLADKYDKQIIKKLSHAVNSVVKGTLLIAIIQGILAGTGFLIFGVPNAILLGLVTVVTALIPAIGTAATIIPAVIYLFMTGHVYSAVGLLLWGGLLVGLIDNFLRPKLLAKDINLHPMLILLSAVGGIVIFGAMGFFIGPLMLSLLFALLDIYQEEFHDYLSNSK